MAEVKYTEEELDQIIKDKWINEVRPSYVTIRDCTLPVHYLKYQKEIDDFEVYDSDIWICSFPRTGTTWTSEMVWMIANNCDYEKAKCSMHDRIRFLDLSCLLICPSDGQQNRNIPDAILDSVNYAKIQAQPRVIKTHFPFQLLPKQIQSGEKKPKIVYVYRNPLDACVSFYYHSASVLSFGGDLEDFCKLYLSNKMVYGNFWDHVLGYWKIKKEPNVLFLKYEDMKKELAKILQETAGFLKRSISEEDVKKLQQHLSFESMKNNPFINDNHVYDVLRESAKFKTPFIRAGAVGGFKAEMPQKFVELFQKVTESKFQGTDLNF